MSQTGEGVENNQTTKQNNQVKIDVKFGSVNMFFNEGKAVQTEAIWE